MRIAVVGLGYIGSVSSGCLAHLGHEVIGLDIDAHKVSTLAEGRAPVAEAGLAALVATAHRDGRLRATTEMTEAVASSDAALVCVATPSRPDGSADDSQLVAAVSSIGRAIRETGRSGYVVIVRSTCLPEVHERLQALLAEHSGLSYGDGLGYACNPEFLREGSAVDDFFAPPKIVFGARGRAATSACGELYAGIPAKTFYLEPGAAALVKYADNAYHAVKVTFGNEMGALCKQLGVDPYPVMEVFCADRKLNISARYLRPGAPFGGSCLPKDVRALTFVAEQRDVPMKMLEGVYVSNRTQIERLAERILAASPSAAVGFIGLSFKEGTPDLRESPFLEILRRLVAAGRQVRVYDPLLFERTTADHDPVADLRAYEVTTFDELVRTCDYLVVTQKLHERCWEDVRLEARHHLLDLTADGSLPCLRQSEELYR